MYKYTVSSSYKQPYTELKINPLLLLPSIFPSIRVFSIESVLPIRWPKYWMIRHVPCVDSVFPSVKKEGVDDLFCSRCEIESN